MLVHHADPSAIACFELIIGRTATLVVDYIGRAVLCTACPATAGPSAALTFEHYMYVTFTSTFQLLTTFEQSSGMGSAIRIHALRFSRSSETKPK